VGLIPKAILLKLFLDMVPSSSADFYCDHARCVDGENACTDYPREFRATELTILDPSGIFETGGDLKITREGLPWKLRLTFYSSVSLSRLYDWKGTFSAELLYLVGCLIKLCNTFTSANACKCSGPH